MKIGRNVREWRRFLQVSVAVAGLVLAMVTTSRADWRDALNKAAQDVKEESDKLEKKLNDSLDSSDQDNLTPDQLAKQADTQLTDAQKLLTEGKPEAAIVQLQDGARSTRLLEKADPQNAALAGLKERSTKLKGDLEKATGQVVDLGPSRGVNIKVETPAPADGAAASSGSSSSSGAAASADELAKDADAQLRKAEKLMFDGKRDESITELKAAAKAIQSLEKTDAQHKQLATLKNKANKLKGDLEKRTGQKIDLWGEGTGEAEKPATEESKQQPAEKPASEAGKTVKMPYHAKEKMTEIEKIFRSIESSYHFLEIYKQENEPPEKSLSKLDEIEGMIKDLQPALDSAKAEAAKEGVTEHPDFDATQGKINEQPKRLEETRAATKAAMAAAATAGAEVEKDVETLAAVLDGLKEKYFNKATGTAIYANDIEPVKETLALIEDFEKNEQQKATSALDSFKSKYGNTPDEVRTKVEQLGYSGNRQPQYLFKDLQEGIENITKTRQAEFDDIVQRIDSSIQSLPGMHDIYRVPQHGVIRDWVKLLKGFAPDKTKADAKAAEAEKSLEQDMKTFLAKVDGKTWPGNSKGEVAEAALKFFKESPDWAKRAEEPRIPLGVAVTGDWSVQGRDVLGNPTMYGIPVLLAVQVQSEKGQNLARVFNLTMRTAESKNPKQEPPFTSITVGDSWYIRPDKVK